MRFGFIYLDKGDSKYDVENIISQNLEQITRNLLVIKDFIDNGGKEFNYYYTLSTEVENSIKKRYFSKFVWNGEKYEKIENVEKRIC